MELSQAELTAVLGLAPSWMNAGRTHGAFHVMVYNVCTSLLLCPHTASDSRSAAATARHAVQQQTN